MKKIIPFIFLSLLYQSSLSQNDILGKYYRQGYVNTSISIALKKGNKYEFNFMDCTNHERSFGIWSIEDDTLIMYPISSIEIEYKHPDLGRHITEEPSKLKIILPWTQFGKLPETNIEVFGRSENVIHKLNFEPLKNQTFDIKYDKYHIYSDDLEIGEIEINDINRKGEIIYVHLYLNNSELEERWISNRQIPRSNFISYSNSKLLSGAELSRKYVEIKE